MRIQAIELLQSDNLWNQAFAFLGKSNVEQLWCFRTLEINWTEWSFGWSQHFTHNVSEMKSLLDVQMLLQTLRIWWERPIIILRSCLLTVCGVAFNWCILEGKGKIDNKGRMVGMFAAILFIYINIKRKRLERLIRPCKCVSWMHPKMHYDYQEATRTDTGAYIENEPRAVNVVNNRKNGRTA